MTGFEKKHVSVFIGSTYEDLKEYRKEVQNVLMRLETIVKGMEFFGSTPNTPLEECLKAVRDSKVYIGIFAARYGSVDEKTGKSFTQLEYEKARELGIPILIYILDEENQPILPKYVDKDEKAIKLNSLKEELIKNYTVSFFTTPSDLGKKVTSDLSKVLEYITNIKIYNDNDNENGYLVYDKFIRRPYKYMGEEIFIKVNIRKGYYRIRKKFIDAHNLKTGDSSFLYARLYDNNDNLTSYSTSIFTSGELSDWIEENNPDGDYIAKVRLSYGITKEFIKKDNENLLSEEESFGLILLEIPGKAGSI